ncbi:GntR family transcriptional regulator [Rathayibacter sp. VKM Ac-2801]|uniref:GntR family transcriptional regulator n=1 Tax=Rathayibacter sp. VKM Ac-2801 TaxID=2609255 RepID=UPI00131FEE40|nr:GntR family transcriptional regulator [Rathayibacter sp. VKM Ac-2801]QHC71842.1 FCD domain-containing protein [Rathayibacter sp. VKM Ac-2801]
MVTQRTRPTVVTDPSTLGSRLGKTEIVYRQIKADIESGVYQPGEQLPEVMLVERTGASRTPVREALRRLAAEQLVDIAPRKAPTVSRLSLKGARALFDYRRLLEPAALREVARRSGQDSTVSAVFLDLTERFEAINGVGYSPDFAAAFAALATEFDDAVVATTPNEYLARAIDELRPHTARLRLIAHADVGRLAESVREHLEMCRAVISGDADRAAVACTQHLFHVDQGIFNTLLSSTRVSSALVDLAD